MRQACAIGSWTSPRYLSAPSAGAVIEQPVLVYSGSTGYVCSFSSERAFVKFTNDSCELLTSVLPHKSAYKVFPLVAARHLHRQQTPTLEKPPVAVIREHQIDLRGEPSHEEVAGLHPKEDGRLTLMDPVFLILDLESDDAVAAQSD